MEPSTPSSAPSFVEGIEGQHTRTPPFFPETQSETNITLKSPTPYEKYCEFIIISDYLSAIEFCNGFIKSIVIRENSKIDNYTEFYSTNSINTPEALEWKVRLEETKENYFSFLMYNKKYELAEEFVLEQIKFCNFTSNTEKAEDWKEKLNNQVYYFIKNNNSSISVDFVHKLYISYNLAIQHSRFEDARNICLKVILYFNEKGNDFLNLSKKDEWEKRLEDVNYIINKNLVGD